MRVASPTTALPDQGRARGTLMNVVRSLYISQHHHHQKVPSLYAPPPLLERMCTWRIRPRQAHARRSRGGGRVLLVPLGTWTTRLPRVCPPVQVVGGGLEAPPFSVDALDTGRGRGGRGARGGRVTYTGRVSALRVAVQRPSGCCTASHATANRQLLTAPCCALPHAPRTGGINGR